MAVSVLVAAVGFRELSAKLASADTKIIVPEVRKAQGVIAREGAKLLRQRSTRLIGRLRKSIKSKTGRNMFAAVLFDPIGSAGQGRTSRKDSGGFRSAWAMDNSSRYHPRSGGMTKGWISGVAPMLQGTTETQLRAAGKAIAAALATRAAAGRAA